MKSQPDRSDKIRALLHSPIEGERSAARAALDRVGDEPPERGSKEWVAAVREWNAKIEYAVTRLGQLPLTQAEIKTVRNLYRYRGDPWSRGSAAFMNVYQKMVDADPARRDEAAPVYQLESPSNPMQSWEIPSK
jgi:hypothetical protein